VRVRGDSRGHDHRHIGIGDVDHAQPPATPARYAYCPRTLMPILVVGVASDPRTTGTEGVERSTTVSPAPVATYKKSPWSSTSCATAPTGTVVTRLNGPSADAGIAPTISRATSANRTRNVFFSASRMGIRSTSQGAAMRTLRAVA
jgi:hypothetical protein